MDACNVAIVFYVELCLRFKFNLLSLQRQLMDGVSLAWDMPLGGSVKLEAQRTHAPWSVSVGLGTHIHAAYEQPWRYTLADECCVRARHKTTRTPFRSTCVTAFDAVATDERATKAYDAALGWPRVDACAYCPLLLPPAAQMHAAGTVIVAPNPA
jgi:hypothetical protein